MSDYPDYTQLFNLVGSDIMVPIDIQGAYIMLPVDIQAQYATLEISIVAQTVEYLTIDIAAQSIGYLAVNLAASAITLNINLLSSTIILDINIKDITAGVTFNIGNIEGPFNIFIGTIQTVGIYLQPEWAAKTGIDKNFYAGENNRGFGYELWGIYNVPGTKTLYLTGLSFALWASAATDSGTPHIGVAFLYNATTDKVLACIGGDGGNSVAFAKPIEIDGGDQLDYGAFVEENHFCDIRVATWGYEVPVA